MYAFDGATHASETEQTVWTRQTSLAAAGAGAAVKQLARRSDTSCPLKWTRSFYSCVSTTASTNAVWECAMQTLSSTVWGMVVHDKSHWLMVYIVSLVQHIPSSFKRFGRYTIIFCPPRRFRLFSYIEYSIRTRQHRTISCWRCLGVQTSKQLVASFVSYSLHQHQTHTHSLARLCSALDTFQTYHVWCISLSTSIVFILRSHTAQTNLRYSI